MSDNSSEKFLFTDENLAWAKNEISKYPKNKKPSAILALLTRAQKQNGGWLSQPAMRYVSNILDIPYIRAWEIVTFYSMFNLSPRGKYFIQVCTTVPCCLNGSDDVLQKCKEIVAENPNELSQNDLCSWTEVECLGACVNAPVVQINDDYFEDMDSISADKLFKSIMNDVYPEPGSQKGRKSSAPINNRITLKKFAKNVERR